MEWYEAEVRALEQARATQSLPRQIRPRNVRELARALRGGSVVVTQKPTETLVPANGTAGALAWQTVDQLVVEPLVVPFAMIVREEIGERSPKMAFT
jgi:hypothetical protein